MTATGAVFGQIVSPSQLEGWVVALTNRWFTEYLAATERSLGLAPRHYAPLRNVLTANEFDYFPEDQLPLAIVMNAGLIDQPARRGGHVDATYSVAVAIVVSSTRRTYVRAAMNDYAAAFKAMILQHRDLEQPNYVRGVDWLDERPAPLPDVDQRSIGAMQMFFSVELQAVVDLKGGPPFSEPRADPYSDDPPGVVIQTASATINLKGH